MRAPSLEIARLPAATNRSEQVAEALGTQIRSGVLGSGFHLPSENTLGQQFGVSRTVVREAIARLKSEGWWRRAKAQGLSSPTRNAEPRRCGSILR